MDAPSRPLPSPKPPVAKPLPKPPGAQPPAAETEQAPAADASPVSSPKPALRPKPNVATLPPKRANAPGDAPAAASPPSTPTKAPTATGPPLSPKPPVAPKSPAALPKSPGTVHPPVAAKPSIPAANTEATEAEPAAPPVRRPPSFPAPVPAGRAPAPAAVVDAPAHVDGESHAPSDSAPPVKRLPNFPAPTPNRASTHAASPAAAVTAPAQDAPESSSHVAAVAAAVAAAGTSPVASRGSMSAPSAPAPKPGAVTGKGLPPAPKRAPPPPPPGASPAVSPRPGGTPTSSRPTSDVIPDEQKQEPVRKKSIAPAPVLAEAAQRQVSTTLPVPPAMRRPSNALPTPPAVASAVEETPAEPVRKRSVAPMSPLPEPPKSPAAAQATPSTAPTTPVPATPAAAETSPAAEEKAPEVVADGEDRRLVVAMWDNDAEAEDEISFKEGDVFEVTNTENPEWWEGVVNGKRGMFPAVYVKLVERPGRDKSCSINHDSDEGTDAESAPPPKEAPPRKLSPEELRVKVMKEICDTEKDYVDDLKLVIEGYEQKMIERKNVPDDVMKVLFGNIDEIYEFQQKFLVTMQQCMQPEPHYETKLGGAFLVHKDGFKIYSEYCNNHPRACEEMVRLLQEESLKAFFLGCRLLVSADISLEGFLLTPVQRICKYPLLLKELLKYTPEGHPDHANVNAALEGMKEVAMLINETKRRMENLEKISEWQHTIDGYQGPDITATSTELILEGSLVKISGGRAQERYFFLFDGVLIYTRKDFLKANAYTFKGRIPTDGFEVVDINDGEVTLNGSKVSNCWKVIRRASKNKQYVLIAKSPEEKKKWMDAFATEKEKSAKAERDGTQPQRRMQFDKVKETKELKSSPSLRRKDSTKEKESKKAAQPLAKAVAKKGLFDKDKDKKKDKDEPASPAAARPASPAFGNVMRELQMTRAAQQ